MIKKTLFSFLIALVAFGFTACDSDDNNGQLGVPDSAKPSKEFKVGNCDKEKNADDAIKLNVKYKRQVVGQYQPGVRLD